MEKKIGKYTVSVVRDENPISPREDDNLGKMVCFHRSYNLGDKHDYNPDNYDGWNEMKKDIIKQENVEVILPLYLYDHSGITMNTTGFSCPWDSGQVGFIFISKEKVRKEYGVKRISPKLHKRITEYLINEVETYDKYLNGEIYGFKVIDEYDNVIESCWGFYDEDECLEEGLSMVPKEPESEEYYTGLLYGVDNNQ